MRRPFIVGKSRLGQAERRGKKHAAFPKRELAVPPKRLGFCRDGVERRG